MICYSAGQISESLKKTQLTQLFQTNFPWQQPHRASQWTAASHSQPRDSSRTTCCRNATILWVCQSRTPREEQGENREDTLRLLMKDRQEWGPKTSFQGAVQGQGRGQAGIVWDTAQGSQHPLLSQHSSDSRDKCAIMALPLQKTSVSPNSTATTAEEKEETNTFSDNTKNTIASWSAAVLTS